MGFRSDQGLALPVMFVPDTFEAFLLASNIEELISTVLSDPFSLVEEPRWFNVQRRLGQIEAHEHFAPIVSPLVGGSGDAENFMRLDALAHLRTAIAEYKATARTMSG